jgi:hypothetical protein
MNLVHESSASAEDANYGAEDSSVTDGRRAAFRLIAATATIAFLSGCGGHPSPSPTSRQTSEAPRASQSAPQPPRPSWTPPLIVPGEGIGDIILGMSVADLRRAVGDPVGLPLEKPPFTSYRFYLGEGVKQRVNAIVDGRTNEVSVVQTYGFTYADFRQKFDVLATLGNPEMEFPNDHWCYDTGLMLDFYSDATVVSVGPLACRHDWISDKPPFYARCSVNPKDYAGLKEIVC